MLDLIKNSLRIPCALRRVQPENLASVLPIPKMPRAGDIALARLESIGKNTRLELSSGRPCALHVGDLLAVVFGNRYATMQFEGYAGASGDACDLLSMGGVCGLVESKHEKVQEPSRLRLLGAIGDAEGNPLRLRDFALPATPLRASPRKVVVCGSAMDVGKTHTAVSLIIGLRQQGCSVAAVKLTGTATGRDFWAMKDAGAHPIVDFVDGGFPSTYLCSLDDLLMLDQLLTAHAAALGASWIVVEIADGLLQKETSTLLRSPRFTENIDAFVFACADPLATVGGVELLRGWGIEPVAISGRLSMSPLVVREASEGTGIPCLTATQLQSGLLNERLLKTASRASLS